MSAETLPTLRVPAALGSALSPAALAALDGAPLVAFLARQRWFGGKGHPPGGARVLDVIPLFGDGSAAVARLAVEHARGPEIYQLPLAVRAVEPDAPGAPRAVLARLEAGGERGVLFDALEDASFRRRLGLALAAGAAFAGPATRWVLTPFGEGGQAIPAGSEGRLVAGEQSNTSIVYEERAILKLYRRLQPGENPEVEIGELLTATAFAHVPALLGTIRFHDADGSTTVAGIVQRFVPAAVDGWTWALARVREQCAAPAEAPVSFAGDAAGLGRITRALHEELASAQSSRPAFAPLPVTEEDLGGWAEAVDHQVGVSLDLLAAQQRARRLVRALDAAVAALLARRVEVSERVRGLARGLHGEAGQCIRHHGDYHLGQVLRTAAGEFVIVDFEGEPTRPLAERRQRHSALRDVAGMLRSFAYAAAVGCQGLGAGGSERAERWQRAARAAFLDGYLGDATRALPAYLPASRAGVARALAFFEIEKAFYELAYELNHRPHWLGIPLGALGPLLDAA